MSPIASGIPCRLVGDLRAGRSRTPQGLTWSHMLLVEDHVDIRDGCSRTAGNNQITYGDGDEIRIPDATGTRYVVVWVEWVNRGLPASFKRVYLLRHAPAWAAEYSD
jgi:hypothetical protein